jgi:hypothetical protein
VTLCRRAIETGATLWIADDAALPPATAAAKEKAGK